MISKIDDLPDGELPLWPDAKDFRQDELFLADPKKSKQSKKCKTCSLQKGFSAFSIIRYKIRSGEIRERYLGDCKACRARQWRDRFENDLDFRNYNQERFLKYAKERRREKNPCWKLKRIMSGWYGRHRLEACCRVLGYGPEQLQKHLESLWEPGMSWDNYAKQDGWQIDHVRECRKFDLNKIEQFKICHALSNLRPLWTVANNRRRREGLSGRQTIIRDSLRNNSSTPTKESFIGNSPENSSGHQNKNTVQPLN